MLAKRMRGEETSSPGQKRQRRIGVGPFCTKYYIDNYSVLGQVLKDKRNALLLFSQDPVEDLGVQLILSIPYLQGHIWVVSPSSSDVAHYQTIHDDSGQIAAACRVLDPLGGGRVALRCLVHVEENRVRAMVPLDFVAPPLLEELVNELM